MILCIVAFGCGKPSPPPVVATVNGEGILLSEFEKALKEQTALIKGESPLTPQETENLKKVVLDNLIQEKILLQCARALSISVSEAKLTDRIGEIRKDYGDDFNSLFGYDGVDYPTWKEALRRQLLIEKVIDSEVNAKIQISDREAERYFIAHRKAYATGRRVHVAQIVLPDRERAEEVLKRLKAGEDFGKVAKEVSIGPEAANDGDLGFFEQGIMPEEIDRVVFALPIGNVSGVVKSPYGFHIFKLLARETAGGRNFEDVKDKVIADLRKQEETESYRDWIDRLKAKADIRINHPPGTALKAVPGKGEHS